MTFRRHSSLGARDDTQSSESRRLREIPWSELSVSYCQVRPNEPKNHHSTQRADSISTWRSLNPICEDSPLAFCDYRSVDSQDLIPSDRIIPERAGEVYYLFHNKSQRWVSAGPRELLKLNTTLNETQQRWLSEQTPNDLAVFVLYDNKPGDQAKCKLAQSRLRSRASRSDF